MSKQLNVSALIAVASMALFALASSAYDFSAPQTAHHAAHGPLIGFEALR